MGTSLGVATDRAQLWGIFWERRFQKPNSLTKKEKLELTIAKTPAARSF